MELGNSIEGGIRQQVRNLLSQVGFDFPDDLSKQLKTDNMSDVLALYYGIRKEMNKILD